MNVEKVLSVISVIISVPLFFFSLITIYTLNTFIGWNFLLYISLASIGFCIGVYIYSNSVAFDFKLPSSLFFISINCFFTIQGVLIIEQIKRVVGLFLLNTPGSSGAAGGGGVGLLSALIPEFSLISVLLSVLIFVISCFSIYIFESIVAKNNKALVKLGIVIVLVFIVSLLPFFGWSFVADIIMNGVLGSIA